MAIWIPEDAKVIVQGITGRQGTFHADKMVEYGTAIVGGCTPGKGGQTVELQGRDFPVWNSVRDAIEATDADATVIYVPPPFAGEAIMEAAEAFDALKGEGVGLAQEPAVADAEVVKFKEQAVPLIHSFLFSKYDLFASSKLTFRDMKEHLSSELGMPYERLKADELSNVIEDAVDNVTNECRAGKTPRDECAAKIGYVLQ